MTKKRCLSIGMTALSILSIVMLSLSTIQARVNVSAASPQPKTLAGYIPSAVTGGQARLIGHHLGTDQLALAIGLPLRNQQALTHLLQEVSTPHNPRYRHYLTQAQANQAFNPTPQQEQQVIFWMKSHGLTVTHTYPNHLLVDVTGSFAQIEQAFHVTINDYTMLLNGELVTFYAPANQPAVDSSVGNVIYTILGLDDYLRFHVDDFLATARLAINGNGHGSPPYYPQDFANAYDIKPLWKSGNTGAGQHIGIVLWGPAPSAAALQQFDSQTGAASPNLQPIPVDGGPKYPVKTKVAAEAGMDVEYTSAMAPGATIDYYEAPDTKQGNSTDSGLDDALNMAATDTNNNTQISNSWGGCEATGISDPFTMETEQILKTNTVSGRSYFFSSGDNGSACVANPKYPCNYKDPYPQYPASSVYATSVGGTTFSGNINGGYPGEVAWNYTSSTCPNSQNPPVGSGGGYSKLFARPAWQTGFLRNSYRGYPDVAADADRNTGAFVCYDVSNGPSCNTIGGTSLATPLWAGMIADVNQYIIHSQGELPLGFITPLLYEMHAGMPRIAYHDIKSGTNGHYTAGSGWDAVTGLGSPDLYKLAQDAASLNILSSYLTGVAAVSTNEAWAVGIDYSGLVPIEQWNGSTWNVVASPGTGGDLYSVAAISANDVWAVGTYYNSNNNIDDTLIEQWNGSTWNVVPSPNPGVNDDYLLSVTAVSANDVWAVGTYYDSSYNEQTLIEQWNGSTWNVVPNPSPGPGSYAINELTSVTAVSANDVWAVGYYVDSNNNTNTLVEQWNGSTWNVVPSPNPGSGFASNELTSVAAVSVNDVWAVGYYVDSTGFADTLIEQWSGGTWNVVPSPSPDPYGNKLFSVAQVSANELWTVGYRAQSWEGSITLIEQWNGSNWSVVPSPNP